MNVGAIKEPFELKIFVCFFPFFQQKIDERAFDGLTSLNYLHLENNRITTIDSATFTSVSALQLLNLDSNRLSTMTHSHIVPLMDNLVNNSALLSLRGKLPDGAENQFSDRFNPSARLSGTTTDTPDTGIVLEGLASLKKK